MVVAQDEYKRKLKSTRKKIYIYQQTRYVCKQRLKVTKKKKKKIK